MNRITFLLLLGVSLLRAQMGPMGLSGEVENAPDRFMVRLVSMSSHMEIAKAYGGRDGRFSFAGLDPGGYEVQITTETGDVLYSEFTQLQQNAGSMLMRLPTRPSSRPVAGLISVRDLTKQRRASFKLLEAGKFEEAVQRDPSFAVAHHELARHFMDIKRPWEARRELLTAIELDPKLTVAYIGLSIADIQLGDPIGAEQSALRALELRSGEPQAAYVRDIARWLQGKGPRPESPHPSPRP